MNRKAYVPCAIRPAILTVVLLASVGFLYAAPDIKDAPRGAELKIVRPAMPNGLYLVDRDIPFLLIEDGQWLDPYEWVEKNGVEKLNNIYVAGRRFERFHIHTQLGNFDGMKLYSLSAHDMLKSSKIVSDIKFDLKKLAPRISAERCANDGKDLWNCKTDGVSQSYLPVQTNCNTGINGWNCPTGITGVESATQKLLGKKGNRELLHLDADVLHKKIGVEFHQVMNSNDYRGLIKVSVFTTQVFLAASKEQLVAGFLNLEFSANLHRNRTTKWQRKPIERAGLAFVWNADASKFIFLQKKKKVLIGPAQVICEKGFKPQHCPIAIPLGMWEINGKTYAAIRYEQQIALWHYPPDQPMNGLDLKGIRAAQIEIIELGNEVAPAIFSTRQFIATY